MVQPGYASGIKELDGIMEGLNHFGRCMIGFKGRYGRGVISGVCSGRGWVG